MPARLDLLRAVGGTKFACSSGIYSDIDLTRQLVRLSRLRRGGSRQALA